MRLRQVATVVEDLESALADLTAVLGLESAYRDRGAAAFGLTNALMVMGDTFFEVLAPKQPGSAAERFLERQGGDAGYMVILQNFGDVEEFRRRAGSLGVRVVWTGDHEDIKGTHLHPKDVGGAILSVDWAQPEDSWRWAGPHWRRYVRPDVVREIVAAEMTSSDPEGMARRWSQLIELPHVALPGGIFEIALKRGRLRFVPALDGDREGVTAFHIECADPSRALDRAAKRGLPVSRNRVRVAGVDLCLTAPARPATATTRSAAADR